MQQIWPQVDMYARDGDALSVIVRYLHSRMEALVRLSFSFTSGKDSGREDTMLSIPIYPSKTCILKMRSFCGFFRSKLIPRCPTFESSKTNLFLTLDSPPTYRGKVIKTCVASNARKRWRSTSSSKNRTTILQELKQS